MADSKRRFLVVPDKAWADATLVSATSQAGLTVQQPTQDTAEGDLRILVSGEPTDEVSSEVSPLRAGELGDFRYLFDDGLDGLSPDTDPVWLRSTAGLSSHRPDILRNEESVYLEPVGFLAHSDQQRVSLLYQRKFSVPWTAHAVPAGASGALSVLAYTRQADNSWSVSPTSLFLQGEAASTCLIRSEAAGYLAVTVEQSSVSVRIIRDDLSVEYRKRSLVSLPGRPYSVSGCALPSGRLLVGVAFGDSAKVLVSDDLGLSWETQHLITYGGSPLVSAYAHVAVLQHNGSAILTLSHVDTTSGTVTTYPAAPNVAFPDVTDYLTRGYVSSSGETWGGGLVSDNQFTNLRPVVDAEGSLALVGVSAKIGSTSLIRARHPGHVFFYPQDIMGAPSDWIPENQYASGQTAISTHIEQQVAVYGLQTAAIACRGAVLLAEGRFLQSANLSGSTPTVTLTASGLRVHTVSERHNLQEQLPFWYDWDQAAGSFFAGGRAQNAAWDAWCLPQDVQWAITLAGGASRQLYDSESTTGYMRAKAASTDAVTWQLGNSALSRWPLPLNPDAMYYNKGTHNASVRFCVRPVTGGSLLRDEAFVRLKQTARSVATPPANGYEVDISLRLECNGSNLDWGVYDNTAGAMGANGTILGVVGSWLEFVLCTVDTSPNTDPPAVKYGLFYREVEPSDNELLPFRGMQHHGWFEYESVSSKVLPYPGFTDDFLRFGHETCLQSTTFDWKSVYLSRGAKNDAEYPDSPGSAFSYPTRTSRLPDVQVGPGYLSPYASFDEMYGSFLSGQGTGSRAHVVGPEGAYFLGGVHLFAAGRWLDGAGEKTRAISVQTTYTKAATNVLPILPVMQEYRSVQTDPANSGAEEVRLVYELDTPLTGTALALFGRNTPAIRIEMNNADNWVAPPVDIQISTPYDPVVASMVEYGFLYATDTASSGSSINVDTNIVTVGSDTPWRKHQFASQETGQQFYAVLYAGFSQTNVYRILDNTGNELILDAPGGAYASPTDLVIFSDRVAFDLGAFMETAGVPLTHVRVTFLGCRWPTDDQQHHKLGALWFGELHDLSEPDFDWQWSRSTASGNTLTDTPAGPTYSKRNRQFRRSFTASKPLMKSALVSDGVDSPTEQIRGSWEEFVNLMERLEVDGTRCALIWQGERAEAGAQVDPTQRTADPLELIACRVQSAGTLQNEQYSCQTMTLASTGETSVPRPRASNQQIVFREEF